MQYMEALELAYMQVWRLVKSSMCNFVTSISRWVETLCIPFQTSKHPEGNYKERWCTQGQVKTHTIKPVHLWSYFWSMLIVDLGLREKMSQHPTYLISLEKSGSRRKSMRPGGKERKRQEPNTLVKTMTLASLSAQAQVNDCLLENVNMLKAIFFSCIKVVCRMKKGEMINISFLLWMGRWSNLETTRRGQFLPKRASWFEVDSSRASKGWKPMLY